VRNEVVRIQDYPIGQNPQSINFCNLIIGLDENTSLTPSPFGEKISGIKIAGGI